MSLWLCHAGRQCGACSVVYSGGAYVVTCPDLGTSLDHTDREVSAIDSMLFERTRLNYTFRLFRKLTETSPSAAVQCWIPALVLSFVWSAWDQTT